MVDFIIAVVAILMATAGVALLTYAVVMHRHQIANFFGAIANPPYNNWVLLVLWIVTVVLLLLAVFMGGGEPFGLSLFREAATAHRPDPQVNFYNPPHLRALYSPGYQVPQLPPRQGSWVWWYLFLGSLALATAFIPIAFHDEIGNAWRRAWERVEQRRRRVRLQRPPVQPQTTGAASAAGTTTAGAGFWGQLRRRLSEHLPADIVAEFINDFVGGAARAIFRR